MANRKQPTDFCRFASGEIPSVMLIFVQQLDGVRFRTFVFEQKRNSKCWKICNDRPVNHLFLLDTLREANPLRSVTSKKAITAESTKLFAVDRRNR